MALQTKEGTHEGFIVQFPDGRFIVQSDEMKPLGGGGRIFWTTTDEDDGQDLNEVAHVFTNREDAEYHAAMHMHAAFRVGVRVDDYLPSIIPVQVTIGVYINYGEAAPVGFIPNDEPDIEKAV